MHYGCDCFISWNSFGGNNFQREREVSIMILLAEQWGEAIREENKNSRSPVGSLRGGGEGYLEQESSAKVVNKGSVAPD